MLVTPSQWLLDVDRGPDWVFVKVRLPNAQAVNPDANGFAEAVWDILQTNLCYRLVLDLETIELLYSSLLGQMILLSKRIHSHSGVLRLCGLSETNQDVLHTCRLESALPNFSTRGEAVMGHRPTQPR